jgi:glycosyltransferase involved in cell wall biosynthesis
MKTLFLCSNTRTEASMRFRVLQFLPHLERAGHEPTVSSFFDECGGPWGLRVARGIARRVRDLATGLTVDRVFVHREAFPLSLNAYVRALPDSTPLIFDFDDAVHLASHGWRGRVARPASTGGLISRADLVFAGNEFLAEYAAEHSRRVRIVPTVVDTDRFSPVSRSPRKRLVVGWVGSPSSARYLDALLPTLDALGRELDFTLRIVGAGRAFSLQHVEVENRRWILDDEVNAFRDLDIGVYPLADDPWSRGKCGFKAIQYMACGVPFVVSPVGVISSIVRDGTDGLWARSPADWLDRLRALIREPDLRARLVSEARRRAVSQYSVAALAPAWIHALEHTAEVSHGTGPLTGMCESGVGAKTPKES